MLVVWLFLCLCQYWAYIPAEVAVQEPIDIVYTLEKQFSWTCLFNDNRFHKTIKIHVNMAASIFGMLYIGVRPLYHRYLEFKHIFRTQKGKKTNFKCLRYLKYSKHFSVSMLVWLRSPIHIVWHISARYIAVGCIALVFIGWNAFIGKICIGVLMSLRLFCTRTL